MNALQKRDAILKALSSRPDSLAMLAKYGVSRTDIGRNAAIFATVRDAMFAELCPGSTGYEGITTDDAGGEAQPPAAIFRDTIEPTIPSQPMTPQNPQTPMNPAALVAQLESTMNALKAMTAAPSPAAPVDLSPLQSQIDDLEARTGEGFATVQTKFEEMETQVKAVQAALSSASPAVKAAAAVAVAKVAGALSPACSLMAKLVPPHGNVTGSAVLLVGGSGTGKSFDAELHARAFDYAPAPFACSPMTEPYELFGAVTQTTTGLAFVDGCVSAAMRHAHNGESVCIILDELPRLSDNVKMTLLTLLTPRLAREGKYAGRRVFSLRTGNAVMGASGVFEPEVIDAPIESVAFIATGNIGEQFNVRSGGVDEAVWKRFVHLRVNWNPSIAKDIFDATLTACGFKPGSISEKVLLPFVEKSREMAEHDALAYPACVRTICRAITISTGGSLKDLRRELETLAFESLTGWEHNGTTTASNADAVKSMLVPLLSPLA